MHRTLYHLLEQTKSQKHTLHCAPQCLQRKITTHVRIHSYNNTHLSNFICFSLFSLFIGFILHVAHWQQQTKIYTVTKQQQQQQHRKSAVRISKFWMHFTRMLLFDSSAFCAFIFLDRQKQLDELCFLLCSFFCFYLHRILDIQRMQWNTIEMWLRCNSLVCCFFFLVFCFHSFNSVIAVVVLAVRAVFAHILWEIFVSILSSHKYSFGMFERYSLRSIVIVIYDCYNSLQTTHQMDKKRERESKQERSPSKRKQNNQHQKELVTSLFRYFLWPLFLILFYNEDAFWRYVSKMLRVIAHFCFIQFLSIFYDRFHHI